MPPTVKRRRPCLRAFLVDFVDIERTQNSPNRVRSARPAAERY
jgi:hypothetical protein